MNETDAISALTDIGETFSTFVGLWLSVTFAYLTVAYLVGKALSRFQCLAISAIYIVAAFVFGASSQGYADGWVRLQSRVNTVFDDVFVFANIPYYGEAAALFLLGGTVLSLYFMYDVRKQKA